MPQIKFRLSEWNAGCMVFFFARAANIFFLCFQYRVIGGAKESNLHKILRTHLGVPCAFFFYFLVNISFQRSDFQ